MIDTIVQIFGMTFTCVIMVCLVWTISEYIFLKFKDKQI